MIIYCPCEGWKEAWPGDPFVINQLRWENCPHCGKPLKKAENSFVEDLLKCKNQVGIDEVQRAIGELASRVKTLETKDK